MYSWKVELAVVSVCSHIAITIYKIQENNDLQHLVSLSKCPFHSFLFWNSSQIVMNPPSLELSLGCVKFAGEYP